MVVKNIGPAKMATYGMKSILDVFAHKENNQMEINVLSVQEENIGFLGSDVDVKKDSLTSDLVANLLIQVNVKL